MRQIKTFAIDSEEDYAEANGWIAKIQEDGGNIISVQFGPSRLVPKAIGSLMLLVFYEKPRRPYNGKDTEE
jgi:hypothetical protein